MSAGISEKQKLKFSILKRVFAFTAPYKNKFYLSLFLAVFLAIIAPLRPLLIQLTINEGIKNETVSRFINGPGGFIIEITLIQVLILLIETIARFYFTFTTASMGQNVVKDLRVTTYKKITQFNLSEFDKTPIGTLTTRTINDIESINDIFSDGLIPIIADMLSIVSVLTYMFWADWKLTLVCLAPFPILMLATYFFKEAVNKSFIKVRNAVANLNAFVQEHITGMSIVQTFVAENREQEKFRAINKEHRNANIKAIFAYSIFFPVVELVSAFSISLLVWWGAKDALQLPQENASHITGIITAFILCISLLFRPLRVIADKFNVLQMGIISSERVFKVLDNTNVMPNMGTLNSGDLKGKLEFKNVSFEYTPGTPVLKNISFTVNPGETLAIVGQTGSGKTSIISLINRLYPISSGQILADGKPIEDYELNFLRSRIGVVLQDVFLFSGSIKDNISLHNDAIPIEKIKETAKLVGLGTFIEKLPSGYNQNVMERGSMLSIGQRQLLSFARALLYNPSILILDEATSSVDTESEMLIQNAIETLVSGRTSIIIAHRLSTIRKAEKIMVLEKGEIKEMGNHEALMNQKGAYFKLYKMQFEKMAIIGA
ncbi:MAG: ABC transporter ATP-binding protein [Chitinophagaceae bacterium]|nr:ABC transporter ATP-binding protein [Chitinophagaceae bacterium]